MGHNVNGGVLGSVEGRESDREWVGEIESDIVREWIVQ